MTPANSTFYSENENFDNSSVHWIFRINGMYYSLIGTLLVTICGYVISIATGGNENLDPKLLSPLFRRFYKLEMEMTVNGVKYVECDTVEINEKVRKTSSDNNNHDDDGAVWGQKNENGKLNILDIKRNEEEKQSHR